MSAPRNPPDDHSPDDKHNNPRSGGADKLPFDKPAQGAQSAQGAGHCGSPETLRDQLIEASLSTHVAPVAWSIGRDRIATIREWLAWQEILCSHPELDL